MRKNASAQATISIDSDSRCCTCRTAWNSTIVETTAIVSRNPATASAGANIPTVARRRGLPSFVTAPITADEVTGVGTLDGTVAGVAMMSLAVWAGGERLAVGICTSLVSPPPKRDRAPAVGEGA